MFVDPKATLSIAVMSVVAMQVGSNSHLNTAMRSLPPQATFVVRTSTKDPTSPTHPCRPKVTVKLVPLLLKTERAIRHEVVGCVLKAAGVCADACDASGGTKMVDKVVETALSMLQRLPSGT